jgi:hypothetical protein
VLVLFYQFTDCSQWRKPVLLFGEQDIEMVAPTYTDEEAAMFMQRQWRAYKARRRVALLAREIVMKVCGWCWQGPRVPSFQEMGDLWRWVTCNPPGLVLLYGYAARVLQIPDPSTGASYYYNPRTGWTSWEAPRFFGPDSWAVGNLSVFCLLRKPQPLPISVIITETGGGWRGYRRR